MSGKMKQLWKIENVEKKIQKFDDLKIEKLGKAIFGICQQYAQQAKREHTYQNYKGELESSIGVVVLKDRNEIFEWSLSAASGTDPAKGLSDFNDVLQTYIVGRSELPDGTLIPAVGLIGIIFAAAPYAYEIESGLSPLGKVRSKKVLHAFTPNGEFVYTILKTVIDGQ